VKGQRKLNTHIIFKSVYVYQKLSNNQCLSKLHTAACESWRVFWDTV